MHALGVSGTMGVMRGDSRSQFVLGIVLAVATSVASAADPGQTGDATGPVDLRGELEQGACAKHELSTDRGCLIPPRITKKVEPRYPKEARKAGVQGHVTLHAVIASDGTIAKVEVVKSTSPQHGFEDAAIAAVKQWRYRPGTIGGAAVPVYFTVTIGFTFE